MEMERLEEEAAREEEEKQLAKEKRVEEEKRIAEERRIEEQRWQEEEERIAEEKRLVEEQKRQEEQAEERTTAFARIVKENKKEKERAAKELEKRRKQTARPRNVEVEIPAPPSGSRHKTFKSKAIISEDSEEEGEDKRKAPTPRGVKRKRTIRMIAKVLRSCKTLGRNIEQTIPKRPDNLRARFDFGEAISNTSIHRAVRQSNESKAR
ncbi:hypothetical protein F5890DRAFT_1560060 [Lentinula detonsa]|uniref:Uncharacterized protein n=1 Tax=Lentinula detonsa TaxID=2804962 RepID=A0AA38PNV4_9AGAR|nr:hypothetical protein F5890DRAFT_1560060 [Lentinula detonsa]